MSALPSQKPSSALLVGRTNVGKSTLFNRLLSRHQAITSAEAGTTRDLNRALLTWRGKTFWVVDSGGFNRPSKDLADRASQALLKKALTEAAVILHLVDGHTGLTPEDRELARQMSRLKIHRVLVINKIDSQLKRNQAAGISLGLPDTIMVSAQNGSGVGDLLDIIVQHLEAADIPQPSFKFAFIGQTNVGKSSLFNALLKTERSLVLPTPHTTRDRVHDYLAESQLTIELIDTAGLRRQHHRAPALEKQSAKQSLDALRRIDVAFITIDSSVSPSWQDQHIASEVAEARVGAVILLTKSDLVKQEERLDIEKRLNRWLPMVSWAPRLWLSSLSNEGLADLLPLAKQTATNWSRRLEEEEMSSFWSFLKKNRTTKDLPLAGFEQTSFRPPIFKLSLRQKTNPPPAIGHWIESQLRKRFPFSGSPVLVRLDISRRRE